jgi:hypothetical protein
MSAKSLIIKLRAAVTLPPQSNVQRALPAVADRRIVKSNDEGAKLWKRKPVWHLPLEHAALSGAIALAPTHPFAGHHECNSGAIRPGPLQKIKQRGMCLTLRHSVQINARVDTLATACDTLF